MSFANRRVRVRLPPSESAWPSNLPRVLSLSREAGEGREGFFVPSRYHAHNSHEHLLRRRRLRMCLEQFVHLSTHMLR
jgi:hypothetical protein